MAEIFNEQRVLGVRLVSDGTLMHNGLPVIGIRDAGSDLFSGNIRTLGVDVLAEDTAIHNDQLVIGAVLIADARDLYNHREVIPATAISGELA